MRQDSAWRVACRGEKAAGETRRGLDEVLREGARRMLQEAIDVEVAGYRDEHRAALDAKSGRRLIVGALPDGTKELVALADGERESALSWKELLLDLKRRGLEEGPEVSVGDGASSDYLHL